MDDEAAYREFLETVVFGKRLRSGPALREREIRLEVNVTPADLTVNGDAQKLEQAFRLAGIAGCQSDRRQSCQLVQAFKLTRPVFGGRRPRALGISFNLLRSAEIVGSAASEGP